MPTLAILASPTRFRRFRFQCTCTFSTHLYILNPPDDLADCPGSRRGAKILAVNPHWQTTIQQGLMW
ncbi:hypothetical protein PAXRUDRAFT_309193 [Paxillus rubicundulus Ve08.2h10]|uniref:Uncharacterized protein n=1 Tax=Paxillus rubicundulus Ve08.2h10 TaxID=930991 RepID=A0A0D0CTP9_9AGAM|nr:hypothetical protein PAXRUDRAFT_309193 [Paxillus rubicundulus Ve08.2h10]